MDEIITDAPWVINQAFLDKHKIDYVAHDALPYNDTSGQGKDVYEFVGPNLLPHNSFEGSHVLNTDVQQLFAVLRVLRGLCHPLKHLPNILDGSKRVPVLAGMHCLGQPCSTDDPYTLSCSSPLPSIWLCPHRAGQGAGALQGDPAHRGHLHL